MKWTLPLRELSHTDTAQAGGKGANLGELAHGGFRIPDGFVLTTAAFDAFLDRDELPSACSDELLAAFDALDAPFVAVRSSATVEDGATQSWAGQFTTLLNVRRERLADAVRQCFMAAESVLSEGASLALVVQAMVPAEQSGVAFSFDPVTHDRDSMVIEAGTGLGDALVSGRMVPDTHTINRRTGQMMTNAKERSILTTAQINELANLVKRIEAHVGYPCDIEWAFARQTLFALQCRPMTAGASEPALDTEGMTFMGVRETDLFDAGLRRTAWTTELERELGVGYERFAMNAKGELFVDEASEAKIDEAIRIKTFADFVFHIQRMRACVHLEQFPSLYAHFLIARLIADHIYPSATPDQRERIEAWRNDATVFSALDAYREQHPPADRSAAWTLVCQHGETWTADRLLRPVPTTDEEPAGTDEHLIVGKSAYQGIARGTVRIVNFIEECRALRAGEIVVSNMTTPDFAPYLPLAGGFVTDEGGILCHAAIIARELKKPCVVGTRNATRRLKDGDMVEVDGFAGTVRIV